ncbi:MAG: MCP four helix bundle domain-containing protein, partial [Zoogloeaceae bacterium]|nr:MCP four helix bundle domain-containing protein [Zoogloeaceae bacterium]
MKNLKIGVRLGIGFGIVVLLLVVIAVVALMRVNELNRQIELTVKDYFPKTVIANNILDTINLSARVVRNLALTDDPAVARAERARIEDARRTNGGYFEELNRTVTSDEGKRLMATMTQAAGPARSAQDRMLELIASGRDEEATAVLFGDLRTTQAAYMNAVTALIDYQSKLMTEAGEGAASLASETGTLLSILGAVAVLFAVGFGVFVTRSITRPVGEVLDAANKMAAGDFNFTLKSDATDEVGNVVRAVGNVQSGVRTMIDDAAMLSKAAVEGRLATRADASKHQGDFRKIVEGVNGTLDAVIGPLNVAADYVDRIAKGAIPAKITDPYNGDFNTIK